MFGYVAANAKTLSPDELEIYKGLYCGLCRVLKRSYGNAGRLTLTYDMTFLILVLSSLYPSEETEGFERCIAHPRKKHKYIETDFTQYAADMNIALTYNKFLDDWNDDKNYGAKAASVYFKNKYNKILEKYPRQCSVIESCLSQLAEVEKKGILSPDIPADIFGRLLSGLFTVYDDENTEILGMAAANLGRFIYILDAWDDLSEDIKKERYNPLTSIDTSNIGSILTMLIADCSQAMLSLPFKKNENIIRNILYSGVWQKYKTHSDDKTTLKNDNQP
jgi:hypothetical protein